MRVEITEQPEALRRTFEVLLPQAAELEALARDTRQILFIARGSSDNAAVYGHYLCSARAGRLTSLGSPSLATVYHADLDLRGVLAVAVSQSGATEEIVTTLDWARHHGARTVAITNVAGSPLAELADVALVTQAGDELAVPATKTYTTQLAAIAVLARSLAPAGAGLDPGELLRVPDAVAETLEAAPAAEELAHRLADTATLVVSGRGFAYSTALEIALKLKETCYVTAVGLSYADLVHGPIAIVDADTPALLVAAADGPMLPEMTSLAHRIATTGAPVFGIGGDREFAATCETTLPVPPPVRHTDPGSSGSGLERSGSPGSGLEGSGSSGPGHQASGPSGFRAGLPEHLAPFALVVPGQLLAEALARAKGLDPDAPRGLDKVTQTDA
jgi:glucosamine--fructose-6-phosphate aminotransferase (isomerizing)